MSVDICWYTEGRLDGYKLLRFRGGIKRAEWYAAQLNLKKDDKEEYIRGFNDSSDEYAEQGGYDE